MKWQARLLDNEEALVNLGGLGNMYPRKPLDERQAVAEALAAEGPEWRVKSVFTTGEVAEICKISQQTVIRCFDSGRLKGFRVPGSKFRRVPRAELIRFMKTNEIPIENLDSGKRRVLIVDDDPAIVDMLVDIIGRDGRFEVKAASNGFDAGALTKEFRPDVVLLDFMLPDINGNVVCQRIKSDPELAHTKIIIVSGAVAPAEIDTLKAAGADEFIQKPFDIARLIESIADLVAA
ncbi:MAG: hypothetical protein AMXMBFR20_07150 [Planctomycetia bacterium]|jgi:excisionase family DNA binding protein